MEHASERPRVTRWAPHIVLASWLLALYTGFLLGSENRSWPVSVTFWTGLVGASALALNLTRGRTPQ